MKSDPAEWFEFLEVKGFKFQVEGLKVGRCVHYRRKDLPGLDNYFPL
jgi:hypothetical protein